jgi:urease accessory protein
MQTVLPDPGWPIGKHALMNLRVLRRNGRSEIDPSSWRIPYQWQGTHYQDHDDQPFLLLINSGGGFVEGDVAELHATLEAGTRALITTTAASKFYKCLEDKVSRELATLHVGPDALLEYYPDESIPFAQSRVERCTRIDLTSSSRLFATDMISAGRIHHGSGEAFAFHSLNSEFAVSVDGKPVVLDRLLATDEGEVRALRSLWEEASHMATVVAYGADFPNGIEGGIEDALAGLTLKASGASRIGNLVTCRILADETWACHEAVQACWAVVRPYLAGKTARPIRKC